LIIQTHRNRPGLALVGHRADEVLGLENLANRHRNGLQWDVVEFGKPTLADLLAAASLLQIDDDVGIVGFKVGRWVVEAYVSVLTDAQKGNIDILFLDQGIETYNFCIQVLCIAVYCMERSKVLHLFYKSSLQVVAKA